MDEATKVFLATVYGESANSSPGAWRAIASVIMNRVGYREWKRYLTPLAIIANTGFDAFTQETPAYTAALRYLDKGEPGAKLSAMQEVVIPILQGGPRTTDAVLYFSPKAQGALADCYEAGKTPIRYLRAPHWRWDELVRVTPEGIQPGDDFEFFRYKAMPGVA